jgi:hypothetical protein
MQLNYQLIMNQIHQTQKLVMVHLITAQNYIIRLAAYKLFLLDYSVQFILPYYMTDDGTATKGSGDQIFPLDARDWIVDYYAGIYFQEDTANTTGVPAYLEAWIFIGDFADTAITNALSGAGIFKATGSFQATTNDLQITGSLIVTDGVSGSFSGSFEGDGSGLTGIPSSAITGLQLFRIIW